MRKEFIVSAMSMLIMAVGCSQRAEFTEPDLTEESSSVNVVHFSTRPIATRTSFGEAVTDTEGNVSYPCYWTSNDTEVKISLNYEYAVVAGINTEETDEDGNIIRSSFDASFDGVDTSNPYTFYMVSPAEAFMWASPERGAVSVSILANQKPSASSVDEKAQILVARSDSYDAVPSNVEVDFSHITSYGKLTLTNLTQNPDYPAEAGLASISIISKDQPIAGSWYYSMEDGAISEKEGTKTIIVDASGIDVPGGDPIWFAAAPVEMAGKSITVRANFSNGSYLERTIKLNDNFNFSSGKVIRFSINMASATLGSNLVEVTSEEEAYKLVTSVSDLSAGDEIIIVNSTSPTYAMTSTSSNSGLSATGSGFSVGSDGYIRLESGTSVAAMTVKTISGSSIVIWDGSGNYLGDSSRTLGMVTTSKTWTVSISNGAAALYIRSGNSNYYIAYSNSHFNLGKNGGTVAIYKKTLISSTAEADLTGNKVTEYSDFGAYLGTTNLVYNGTTDQISREYGTDGNLTFSIIDPLGDQVVEFSGIPSEAGLGSNFTLGVKHIAGINIPIDKSYDVFVVKEEAHKLWLADGEGNGFIVKR